MSALLAFLLAAPACLQDGPPASGESYALFRGLGAATRIHLSVPSGPCERAAERLAGRMGPALELVLAPEPRAPADVRMLVGAPTDREILPCARACGVEPVVGGFRVLGRDYTRAGDALLAVMEDPEQAGRPLCFVLGNDLELVSAYLDGIPRLARPYLWIHADGEPALECPLEPDGRPRAAEARDFRARRAQYFEDARVNDDEDLSVHARGSLGLERWRPYALALGLAQRRVVRWFEASAPPPCELYVYEHLEDFEACLGTSALALVNRFRPRVHVLVAPGMPDDGGAAVARVLARTLAGMPAAQWVEDGLAVAAADSWWLRPLDEWISHLAAGNLLPSAADLFAPSASGRFSEHALLPARGLFFRQSVQAGDAGRVRALWKGAGGEPERNSALYQRAVRAARAAAQPQKGDKKGELKAEQTKARERRSRAAAFRHGLALVEGARAGHGARAVDEALAAARALEPGPDAVSLTVLATAEDPRAPVCPARLQAVFGSAGDLALASTAAAARAGGMAVLLALEVLARPTGAWADVLSWTGGEEQSLFWTRYGRIAEHYALLSELLGLELYSFGSNLGDENGPQLFSEGRARWEELIARLRTAYRGGLVFTARSVDEAEAAGFLGELDLVGLSLFPRGLSAAPDEGELQRVLRFELQQALDLGVRWNCPLLLVQVGFPARADSWSLPGVPRGALDLGAQQRYFAALADVLEQELANAATLRGYFLWNWPLDAERGGALDGGFSLREKPVESVLRRLFAR